MNTTISVSNPTNSKPDMAPFTAAGEHRDRDQTKADHRERLSEQGSDRTPSIDGARTRVGEPSGKRLGRVTRSSRRADP